jgi:penicillin-insensitive murein DD-endopeptidase
VLLHPRVLGLSLLLVAPIAAAGPPPKSHAHHAGPAHPKTASFAPVAHRVIVGRSVGSPTDGHLIGGAHLPDAPYLRIVPVYAEGDARWGLEPLVGMIDRAGRALRKQFPESILSLGHLSRAGGGNIDRHASHESGRDADIGFFVKNQQGKSIYADHFVAFKGDGTASSWPGAQFDDARNWALVSSIVSDTAARVTHIFVAMPLRTRLLQYAEKIGAPAALRARAAELMAQPRGSLPHDDHFHVRIACPAGMDKCIEQPLPRKHPHGALARYRGAEKAPSSGAAHAPGHGEAKASTRTPSHEKADESEKAEARSEPSVPNLAPMVPGLDSVIIPAPLTSALPDKPRSPSEEKPEDKPTPPPFLIDDPDGVLEPR